MAETVHYIRETITRPPGIRERFVPLRASSGLPLRQVHVNLSGISDVPKGYTIERKGVSYHELLYGLRGAGELQVEETRTAIPPRYLLIVPAKTDYVYRAVSKRWRIMWFHIDDRALWMALRDTRPHVRSSTLTRNLHTTLDTLLSESVRTEPESRRMALLLSELTALYLKRELAASDTGRSRVLWQKLHDLWEFVSEHLDHPWTVPELAGHLNMSASHFNRVALRYAGYTPKRVLFNLRMQRAEELLLGYDYPLAAVAEKVGYATPFAFSNAFRRYKGISPSAYRVQRRED